MSDKIMVDSGVWIAAFYEKDDHHLQGKEFVDWFDTQNQYEIIITNLILAEVLNHLQRKTNPILMRKTAQFLITNPKIEIYYDAGEFQDQTMEILNRIDSLSYVDSNIALFYRLLNCKFLISFDSNFNAIEKIIRLETPPNYS